MTTPLDDPAHISPWAARPDAVRGADGDTRSRPKRRSNMRRKRILIWGIPAILYAVFVAWYTDFRGPLSDVEIAEFMDQIEAENLPVAMRAPLREFMESDTGRQFLMLNVIDYADDPPDVVGAEPGESAEQLMGRYMEHMYAEFFKRASHPVIMGDAVSRALDLVGVDGLQGAERWDVAALVRHRSRRSFLEIVTIPETMRRHEFKIAALGKTIAYPIEPDLYLGDLRLLLGLGLLAAAALLDFALVRAPSTR